VALGVAACGPAAAPPQDYVLGHASGAPAAATSLIGLPVVEIRPVRLPDYLDSTDLVTLRPGGQVVPSPTGRWAERLSLGVARSVAASLTARLPDMVVTTAPPERATWQVLIDLDAFELQPDGNCVLAGRWSVRDADHRTLDVERVSLRVPVQGDDDAPVVAAMTLALDTFTERIASALRSETVQAQGTNARSTSRPRAAPAREPPMRRGAAARAPATVQDASR
jgi:uncharacterized lipoprotein YmbA